MATTNHSLRPEENPRTNGSREVQLYANSYRLRVSLPIYQYSVAITPPLDSFKEKRTRIGLINEITDKHIKEPYCIYDNTSLFSYKDPIPQLEFDLERKRTDRETKESHVTKYKVVMELVHCFTPDGEEEYPFNWLNVFIRKLQEDDGFVNIKRNMLDPRFKRPINGTNLELWEGTRFVIYRGLSGVNLVADKTHGILRTDTVLQAYERTNSRPHLVEDLKNSFIVTHYGDRYSTYRIINVLTDKTPRTYTFPRYQNDGSKKDESVEEYYKDRYGITLTPDQPILMCKTTGGRASTRLCAIPMEVAHATGIPEEIRRDFMKMKAIKEAHQSAPAMRKQKIEDVTGQLLNHEKLVKSGIEPVEKTMLKLTGRSCPPVELVWGGNTRKPVRNGNFRDHPRDATVLRPVPLTRWVIVHTDRDRRAADNLVSQLQRVAKNVKIDKPDFLEIRGSRPNEYVSDFKREFSSRFQKHQLVVFILPDRDTRRYRDLKIHTETECPIPSQCVLGKNAVGQDLSKFTGIWTQVQQKIGGVCWAVPTPSWVVPNPTDEPLADGGVMTMGINVTKTSPFKPGLAAFVASYNHEMTLFHQRTLKLQAKGELIEQRLDSFTIEALKQYKARNKDKLPSYIFIYRDALAEVHFQRSIEVEYRQILTACQGFDEEGVANYRPRISWIVTEKKTNHRLFTADNRNPDPGTIVDTDIVSAKYNDFFMVSQSVSPQTTALPSRYVILKDRTRLTPAQIQDFTHSMCYCYCNYLGAISMPLPVHMASKLSMHTMEVLGVDNICKLPDTSYQI
ncbi:piwi-like protein [Blattamonas nauphoetae]|uniref:Piwi-like protein n=1 Tax=Blattamonas nauphoetae TaxID=2049346 RepID=A0ABQ9XBZ8_9EUKA|nr:piwi-like protein [Blattamonas nauphoetae]